MTTGFKLTVEALEDLKNIARFTQDKWGRNQRNRYLKKLDGCFHALSHEPQMGVPCDYISSGYRKYHIGRHLIFYRQKPNQIEIIRILHDRMDVAHHLLDS